MAVVSSDGVTSRSWRDVVGTLARLGLAAVWLVSGAIKAADPMQTWAAVHAYQVLPPSAVELVAAVLPWFELALGVLLLIGLGVRHIAVISGLVLLAFMAGVTQAWARGLSIDCGCFGGGGAVDPDKTSYGTELLRDTGFLVLAAWLIIRPRTLFALENVLTRGTDPDPGGGGT
ncbi:MauE/DoxX family redox-associated membrane protein [Pseudonocardia spinosispora]|uniref:MauE/DoxX family redox-associated membrane protein n=1 Tax=Pseudonocardia spinosispora TaxID=103441 RepID=UPI001FE1BA69|nr:MauE/DoxX family redox-associated membrane protein [Pseudonocardia spinosispora]